MRFDKVSTKVQTSQCQSKVSIQPTERHLQASAWERLGFIIRDLSRLESSYYWPVTSSTAPHKTRKVHLAMPGLGTP